MDKLDREYLVEVCKARGELDFLFEITKNVAENGSIGEGYPYCPKYKRKKFVNGIYGKKECMYLNHGGLPVYKLYLDFMNRKKQ